jgi:DNA-binding SARP family transcriptional activator
VDPAPTTRISLLDGFTLCVAGRDVEDTVGGLPHGAQRLIAHLSLCGHPARGAIAGRLWPDVPESHAHGSLRSALWRVHKVVPGLFQVSGGAIGLAENVRVDVRELTRWAEQALDPDVLVDGLVSPQVAVRGELLPGWYDDWVLLERERLRQLRMHAFEALADKLARAGRYGEAVQAAYAAVRDEPLRESAHRAVIRVHLAEGNLAEAVRAYCAFRELLAAELNVAPTRQMEELIAGARGRVHVRTRGPAITMPRTAAVPAAPAAASSVD